MDKNNTILLQDYKIKDKIYIRNIEIRRNGNKNYIVVSHQKCIAYATDYMETGAQMKGGVGGVTPPQ